MGSSSFSISRGREVAALRADLDTWKNKDPYAFAAKHGASVLWSKIKNSVGANWKKE